MCARLVKMFAWLKDEIQETEAVCVASKLLIKDDGDTLEAIKQCKGRRLTVDKLLKFVLKKSECYIKTFFDILKEHHPTDQLEAYDPTDVEVKGLDICFNCTVLEISFILTDI